MILHRNPWHGAGDARDALDRLEWLARQIRNLAPDWRDPRRFYERRDDLAAEARRLASNVAISRKA